MLSTDQLIIWFAISLRSNMEMKSKQDYTWIIMDYRYVSIGAINQKLFIIIISRLDLLIHSSIASMDIINDY